MEKYSSHSDAALLEMWREGDSAAGSQLFDRHYKGLTHFLSKKVPGPHLEDLTQESFLAMIENMHQVDGLAEFHKYLWGIARHKVSDHYRRWKRTSGYETDVRSLEELCVIDPGPSPATHAAENEEQRNLHEALRHVPWTDRIVLELYYWKDFSVQEISEVLAIPLGTAKTRLRIGRRHLRKQFAKDRRF